MQNAQTLSYRHFPHSTRLILRYSTEDTPSLLHINSIASPSFRWSNYGDTMEKLWRNERGVKKHNLSMIVLSFS